VLALTAALLLVALVIHLALWRIRRPKYHVKALLKIFFAVALVGVTIARLTFFLPPTALLHVLVCFVSATLAYIIVYTALEVDSPTLVMILLLEKAGEDGVSRSEILALLNDDIIVKPRVRDLVRDRMLVREIDGYRETTKGRRFIIPLNFYYRLITKRGGAA
jgi:hypothetical protein